ncbi:MAG: hypothetical protein IKC17_00335 [Bacteroidales bacterium]|nr:hypothetical protein [Bacteroidales bacterium]
MKRIYLILLISMLFTPCVFSQEGGINYLTKDEVQAKEQAPYRRSSLYSVLISHPHLKMDKYIVDAYMSLETPDKYNNHDLSVKCLTTYSKKDDVRREFDDFLRNNQVAKRLVSKWFMRDKTYGWNSADLVMERGLYDIDATDIEEASQTKRGMDALADRGFELIENTFVIANDITYVDHEQNADVARGIFAIIGAVAAIATGDDNNIVTAVSSVAATISSAISGFTVKITSYLYQLDWTQEIADKYFEDYYIEKPQSDEEMAQLAQDPTIAQKKSAYENDNKTFTLSYLGKYQAKSAKPVLRGLYNPTDVFRKVCGRAIDDNVMALQKSYDQFKVKVPLYSTEPLLAKIGMKEGVNAKTRYEVLMPVYDESTGRMDYRRRGVIRPIPEKIWDNRYMATEEDAVGSYLNSTSFEIVSGGNFTEGMLIREMGGKSGSMGKKSGRVSSSGSKNKKVKNSSSDATVSGSESSSSKMSKPGRTKKSGKTKKSKADRIGNSVDENSQRESMMKKR